MDKYPCHNKTLNDLPGEQWREVPHTEGYYQVSNLGRVKALARLIEPVHASVGYWTREKILSQRVSKTKNLYKNDYSEGAIVTYQFNKIRQVVMVRRLVYEVFVQQVTKEKMEGKYVYPLDGDGLNSKAVNLALATKSELRKAHLAADRYIPPAFVIDQEKNRDHLLKLNRKKRRKIKQFNLKGDLLKVFSSITMASRKTGVSISYISSCANKVSEQAKGFVWRFEDDHYDGRFQTRLPVEKAVVQYTIAGKKIAEYNSINEASRQTHISQGGIGCSARKERIHAGGYIWRYAGEKYKGEYRLQFQRRRIAQYNIAGKKLACFNSIPEAAKATGCSYEGIRLVLNKKMRSSGGFKWSFFGKPAILPT